MHDLQNSFKLTLRDDSLAPKHLRGDFVELQRDLVPMARDWVLVRTVDGEHHLVEFIDLGAEGWVGVPVNKVQDMPQAITSRAGAAVVAVYVGGGVSGRMSGR